jgi:hypothetical protein
MTTSRDNSPERTLSPRLTEAWRRWGVVHAATEREHATELAVFPDLLQAPVPPTIQTPVAASPDIQKAVPADAVINLAARREAAEADQLAALRNEIDRLAA